MEYFSESEHDEDGHIEPKINEDAEGRKGPIIVDHNEEELSNFEVEETQSV